jgi:hypothetical protein
MMPGHIYVCIVIYLCDTRYVNIVTHPVIINDWGNDLEGLTKGETYPWSFVTQIYLNGQPNHATKEML